MGYGASWMTEVQHVLAVVSLSSSRSLVSRRLNVGYPEQDLNCSLSYPIIPGPVAVSLNISLGGFQVPVYLLFLTAEPECSGIASVDSAWRPAFQVPSVHCRVMAVQTVRDTCLLSSIASAILSFWVTSYIWRTILIAAFVILENRCHFGSSAFIPTRTSCWLLPLNISIKWRAVYPRKDILSMVTCGSSTTSFRPSSSPYDWSISRSGSRVTHFFQARFQRARTRLNVDPSCYFRWVGFSWPLCFTFPLSTSGGNLW